MKQDAALERSLGKKCAILKALNFCLRGWWRSFKCMKSLNLKQCSIFVQRGSGGSDAKTLIKTYVSSK